MLVLSNAGLSAVYIYQKLVSGHAPVRKCGVRRKTTFYYFSRRLDILFATVARKICMISMWAILTENVQDRIENLLMLKKSTTGLMNTAIMLTTPGEGFVGKYCCVFSRRGQTTPQMFHEGYICFFHIFLNQIWQVSFDCCPVHFNL